MDPAVTSVKRYDDRRVLLCRDAAKGESAFIPNDRSQLPLQFAPLTQRALLHRRPPDRHDGYATFGCIYSSSD
jgi:hypothetical protein